MYCGYKDKGKQIPETQIRHVIFQIVSGIAYMHKVSYF
jgi:hypothetical protein